MKTVTELALAVFLMSTAVPARGERLVLVAGGGAEGDGAQATRARLTTPFGVGFDPEGALIFVELTGERVRKVGRDGTLSTIAGTGRKGSGGDGGPAEKAEFNGMHSLAVAGNGDVYLADTWNNRVRKIDAHTGRVVAVAGTGRKGFSGDGGKATEADFGGIYCLALDEPSHALYLADLDNRRVRVVNLVGGTVETVAGNGEKGVPVDGSDARNAPLVDPRAVAVGHWGKVYILERSGHALRLVSFRGNSPFSRIRTVAGTGKAGDGGDNGPAAKAALNGPKHLCADAAGNLYIADTENHRVRFYNAVDGTIRTVAGTGRKGTAGLDGPPAEAELNQPHGVAIGPDGALYIADSSNDRILKIVP